VSVWHVITQKNIIHPSKIMGRVNKTIKQGNKHPGRKSDENKETFHTSSQADEGAYGLG
jgi:hypothetical protein